jgi:hypothetical protein
MACIRRGSRGIVLAFRGNKTDHLEGHGKINSVAFCFNFHHRGRKEGVKRLFASPGKDRSIMDEALSVKEAARTGVIAALAAVYLSWSTTYLAIRIALEDLPPFFLMGFQCCPVVT